MNSRKSNQAFISRHPVPLKGWRRWNIQRGLSLLIVPPLAGCAAGWLLGDGAVPVHSVHGLKHLDIQPVQRTFSVHPYKITGASVLISWWKTFPWSVQSMLYKWFWFNGGAAGKSNWLELFNLICCFTSNVLFTSYWLMPNILLQLHPSKC